MKVKLLNCTPKAEEHIVEVARVSSKRTDKTSSPSGLINYLIRHQHWSPFEHAYMTLEIETSRAIGTQLLRHRSFTFQEFSQRYQDVSLMGECPYEPIQLRKQCENNRQSSTEEANVGTQLINRVDSLKRQSWDLYKDLLEEGISRECARFVLPLCVRTTIHMTGSVRSWIHFLDLRDDGHAQKEVHDLAKEIRLVFNQQFPLIAQALEARKVPLEP